MSTAPNNQCIKVLSNDTDGFLLMAYNYIMKGVIYKVFMEETSSNRTIIDIGATVEKHKHLVPQLLGMHVLRECNTVSHLGGIGKAKGQQLHLFGNATYDLRDVITEARERVATCYGSNVKNSLFELNYHVWLTKTARKCATKTTKLKSLPPTSESCEEDVKHAIWKAAVDLDPP